MIKPILFLKYLSFLLYLKTIIHFFLISHIKFFKNFFLSGEFIIHLKSSTGNSAKRFMLLEQSNLVSAIINFFEIFNLPYANLDSISSLSIKSGLNVFDL